MLYLFFRAVIHDRARVRWSLTRTLLRPPTPTTTSSPTSDFASGSSCRFVHREFELLLHCQLHFLAWIVIFLG